ncbi:MAG TPA: YbaB/EbfC family nucleoid-associated protein [Dehalococcoidia bacterium]|nr:YbaB/EbfC family nucleoid-associated protein [Dehalococcoidia bacterium]
MNLSMINQARQLKAQLDEAQKELAKTEVVAEAGKGAVKVTANGQQQILSVTISPEAMDANDVKQLERLLLKAITDAQAKSQKVANKRMKKLTGGIHIPGLF